MNDALSKELPLGVSILQGIWRRAMVSCLDFFISVAFFYGPMLTVCNIPPGYYDS